MKRVLIKISGELFNAQNNARLPIDKGTIDTLAQQIKELSKDHQMGIVLGAGNFFRGTQHGAALQLSRSLSDQVGMLGTVMNSIMLQEVLSTHDVKCSVSSAFPIPGIAASRCLDEVERALQENECIIFAGGTGCPLFSTDTNAIIRATQIRADEVWKATKVDHVYTQDPHKYPDAKPLLHITYQEALNRNIGVMDRTALCLAQEQNIHLRIFNLFSSNALVSVAHDMNIGSKISNA